MRRGRGPLAARLDRLAARGHRGRGAAAARRARGVRLSLRLLGLSPDAGDGAALGHRGQRAAAAGTVADRAAHGLGRVSAGLEARPVPLSALRPHVDRGARQLAQRTSEPALAAGSRDHLLPGATQWPFL